MSEQETGASVHNESSGSASGNSVQAGAIHGDVHFHRDAAPPAVIPRQLPGAVRHFVNRAVEQDALTTLLNGAPSDGVLLISAIDGTAGVGKSTLAVQWAHRSRERFPDGELYANLRGFDPAAEPMLPSEALAEFLTALGIPADRVPASTDGRTALFRSLVHGRKMLMLLDNVRSAEQVRAVLPGTPSCLVLVTSRNRLDDLVFREGASRMTLEILTRSQSRDLLVHYLGADRLSADPDAFDVLIEHCAGLPLALGIVAVRAAADPGLPIDDLVAELRHEQQRLDALDSGGETGVRAVLSWSYRSLSTDAAWLFRLLGLPTGPDTSLAAAADLAGLSQRATRKILTELTRAHLLEQHTSGRYRFHDLLRAYASERAMEEEPAAQRQAAIRRLLDHYLRTSCTVERRLAAHSRQFEPELPTSRIVGLEFSDDSTALFWWDTERANLIAAIRQAAGCALHQHAWQLAYTLTVFFQRRSNADDQIAVYAIALDSARQVDDQDAEAHLRYDLSGAYYARAEYEKAAQQQECALPLIPQESDPYWAGMLRIDLGMSYVNLVRYDEAAEMLRRGLELEQDADDLNGQGYAHAGLALLRTRRGEYDDAFPHFHEALRFYRQVGEQYGEGFVLNDLSDAYSGSGRADDAIDTLRQAVTHRREIGHRQGEASSLRSLGTALRATGADDEARQCWEQARTILDALGHPEAAELRALLEIPE